ncbi:MAG: (d)CMP kinase [Aureispira sp.]|nr:(d)CMP kinase [Aureispira sp.]
MNEKIVIAIDGYAACGKSTLAKDLAKSLKYAYVDSGAMYRAVTLYFLDNNVDIKDETAVELALNNIKIHFENIEGKNHTFLNDTDVEEEIRTMRISDFVSPVSTVSAVRRAMVKQQQAMGETKGVVMDGRDIGTVVFKNAELKLFLTASPKVRTERRLAEWQNKGVTDLSFDDVQKNLLDRDHIDSTREDSPLRQAEDAIVIDNSELSPKQQMERALDLATKQIEKKTLIDVNPS